MRAGLLAVLVAGAAACGGFDSAGNGDGGVSFCGVRFEVTPAQPVAPATLSATAIGTNISSGFLSLTWQVEGPQGSVVTTSLDASGLRVSFPAATPGSYRVAGSAFVGFQSCAVSPTTINVRAPEARTLDIRLRYTPLPGQGAPAQIDRASVRLFGGADLTLPALRVLDSGGVAEGRVMGPGGGLAAYLRLDSVVAGTFELDADSTGRFSGRLPAGSYRLLVVPHGAAVAPALFASRTAAELSAGLTLDAGEPIAGVVRTAGGDPVAGARVAVASGGLPAVVVVTDAAGVFSARARSGEGMLALTVLPPGPLARVTASVTAFASVEVGLPPSELVSVGPVIRDAAGAAAPGARVIFVAASVTPAGTVSVDGAAAVTAPASARAIVVAGEGGRLPPLQLPRGIYEVMVDPAPTSDDVPRATAMDLVAGTVPASLASGASAPTRVTVRAGTVTVAGAHVVAEARGLRGIGAGVVVAALTNASGVATLALAPGMPYAVTVDPPAGARLVRARATVAGGAAELAVELPPALRLSGTVVFSSGAGQAGVRVEALCVACADPTLPLAETITAAGGTFVLSVPDPGTN